MLFVVPANRTRGGELEISCFVSEQASSLENTAWSAEIFPVTERHTPAGLVRSVRELRSRVLADRPVVVHAQYGSVTAAVSVFGRAARPVVVSFCGDDLLGTPVDGLAWRLRESASRALGVWAARRAAAIVVKSANLMRALPPDLKSRAVILPNGVDMNLFRPEDRAACRQRLGWDEAEPVVLFNPSVGDDRRVKNLPLAEAAMQKLGDRSGKPRLVMLSGLDRQRVRWAMNAADCLLVTSLHEGSPNIVKEAMASNLPVVSVPCGDVVERLNGVWPGAVCPYDASALAQGIADVMTTGRRSNGRLALIEQKLDAPSVAGRLAELYARVTAPTAA